MRGRSGRAPEAVPAPAGLAEGWGSRLKKNRPSGFRAANGPVCRWGREPRPSKHTKWRVTPRERRRASSPRRAVARPSQVGNGRSALPVAQLRFAGSHAPRGAVTGANPAADAALAARGGKANTSSVGAACSRITPVAATFIDAGSMTGLEGVS